ncbi:CCA-adding enzyme [Gossypium arboreum]|uniref:CCA-adding enzyme n=1 Tax=Gossypium arboreum TaxID=29729 RepID=A0A0B0P344_GOSAR|nr:CCA-adding enzyme [Gossypium arboreum]
MLMTIIVESDPKLHIWEIPNSTIEMKRVITISTVVKPTIWHSSKTNDLALFLSRIDRSKVEKAQNHQNKSK